MYNYAAIAGKKSFYYTILKNHIQPEVGIPLPLLSKGKLTISRQCEIIPAHMRIIRGLKNVVERFPMPVLTLGNFDGVHLGHQAIFKKVVEHARMIGGTSIAFTFEPHPLKVLVPDRSPKLLNTFHGKMKLLAASGIDVVICANFTRAFAEQHPEDFARTVLHDQLGVHEIFVGYDYAFGKGREGSIESLKTMGQTYGFEVGVVEAIQVNGIVVSSSAIRELISSGNVDEAAKLLGRDYILEGEVIHGSHRGQTLGFPTANLHTSNELLPGFGVYAVRASVDDQRVLDGVASIGVRPTFDAGAVSIEVFLFNFEDNLYGKQMDVSFIKRLRGERKFPDANALVAQVRKDVEEAKKILCSR
jgi:riboflavin kinase / FMN adenylyltransferase